MNYRIKYLENFDICKAGTEVWIPEKQLNFLKERGIKFELLESEKKDEKPKKQKKPAKKVEVPDPKKPITFKMATDEKLITVFNGETCIGQFYKDACKNEKSYIDTRVKAIDLGKLAEFERVLAPIISGMPSKLKKEESQFKIKEAGSFFADFMDMAERFWQAQPFFYTSQKIWWIWNFERYCWEMVDEVDLLNEISSSYSAVKTFENKTKTEIVNSLKQVGRRHVPKDPPETWLQFQDKIVDFTTGETFESSADYFFTNPLPHKIGESEDTPIMDKVFSEWVGEENKQLLFEIIAFSISPKYFINDIFCFVGGGSNGKSKYLGLVKNFIGGKNCCSTDLDLIASNRFEASKMYKKLVAFMGETNFNILSRTNLLKRLVGGDLIGIEMKGKDGFDAENYSKIFIATNSLPATEDKTKGFYRRWLIIDFPNDFTNAIDVLETIPEEEYQNLAKKSIRLLAELRTRREFTKEPTLEEKIKKYEERSNPVMVFIAENYIKDPFEEVPFFQFYDELIDFLKEGKHREISKRETSKILERLGYSTERKHVKKSDGKETTWHFIVGLKSKAADNLVVRPESKPEHETYRDDLNIEPPSYHID